MIEVRNLIIDCNENAKWLLDLWNSFAGGNQEYVNAPDDDTILEDTHRYIQTFHNFTKVQIYSGILAIKISYRIFLK